MPAATTIMDRATQFAGLLTPVLLTLVLALIWPLDSRLTIEEKTSVHHDDISQLRTDVALLTQAVERLAAQKEHQKYGP